MSVKAPPLILTSRTMPSKKADSDPDRSASRLYAVRKVSLGESVVIAIAGVMRSDVLTFVAFPAAAGGGGLSGFTVEIVQAEPAPVEVVDHPVGSEAEASKLCV